VTAPAARKSCLRGTHRAVSPAETLARIRPLFARAGITRVADVTGLDRVGVPVAMAHRPDSRSVSVSPGKGLDLDAARASAAMEALEGWHAERVLRPVVYASRADLPPGHHVVDLDGLPRVAARPFDPHLALPWIEGRDLFAGRAVWLPFELVHTRYTHPLVPSSGAFALTSNGLASGNVPFEALAHALCEVVERDAVSLWRAGGARSLRATSLDLATVDDPDCRGVLARFERAGVEVGAWEVTADTGVATFACEVAERAGEHLRPFLPGFGSGTHPRRAIALLRALTEAAQTRLTTIAGARDDLRVAQYLRALDESQRESALARIATPPARTFSDAPDAHHDDFDGDLAWLLDRLSNAGIRQVVAVDLARPDVGIPVVRAVVPGLEGASDAPGVLPGARRRRVQREAS
jgi:YcaO-like protein with predicted kinase domain